MSVKLAPSILSCDFARLGEEVRAVVDAGAQWVHVDVMDGHFVPNITIGPGITAAVRSATKAVVDVHLMIESPDRYLEDFVSAGADWVTVHVEACTHLHRTIEAIRSLGASPGVALNPATSLTAVEEVLDMVDMVLIMSVNPGFGGQAFIPSSVRKVAAVAEMCRARSIEAMEIQVDGGVDADNAPALVEAGATVLVAGSAVYRHPQGATAGVQAIFDAVA